jgi:hypothetical protein
VTGCVLDVKRLLHYSFSPDLFKGTSCCREGAREERSSVVVKELYYKPEGPGFWDQ